MSELRRYPDYKDSGVPWLGKIPSHWEVKAIKRISRIHRGASPRPIADSKYFDDEGEYAWVRIADVTASDDYLLETTQRLSELGASLSVKMQPDQIFLSIAGSVGKPIITKIKACIHDGFVYFPDWNQSTRFLYYIFASGQPYLGLGKLGTQLNLNTETVGSIKIGIPDLGEQQAIVNFLDTELAHIDTLINKQQQLIEKLAEQRSAVITHAVTKGLDPDAPMKDSGVEWLGEIPKNWGLIGLQYVLRLRSGSTVTALDFKEEGSFPVYGGNGFRGLIDSFTHDGTFILIGRQGALCGNIKLAKGKFFASEHALVAHPVKNYDEKWLYYLLNSMNLNQYSTSAAQPGISAEVIGRLRIPFPLTDEQTKIASYLDDETQKIDKMSKATKDIIAKLQEYRSALITQAVTGKIDVRHINKKES